MIAALGIGQRREASVVEDEQVDACALRTIVNI